MIHRTDDINRNMMLLLLRLLLLLGGKEKVVLSVWQIFNVLWRMELDVTQRLLLFFESGCFRNITIAKKNTKQHNLRSPPFFSPSVGAAVHRGHSLHPLIHSFSLNQRE